MKFYQTLNQHPRSMKNHGKHRRASPPAHGSPAVGTDYSAGGSSSWTTVHFTRANWTSTVTIDDAANDSWLTPEPPKHPAVPYAGIRTGELIGHRLWWVVQEAGEPTLCSLAHRRPWLPNETITANVEHLIEHDYWFNHTIWGGTYAFMGRSQCQDEIEQLAANCARFQRFIGALAWLSSKWTPYNETGTFVVGTLKMWGEVIECETGYRAQFAKLNSIDEIYGPGDIEALRARYGVR